MFREARQRQEARMDIWQFGGKAAKTVSPWALASGSRTGTTHIEAGA